MAWPIPPLAPDTIAIWFASDPTGSALQKTVLSRMLKKSASFVLASLRGSMYRSVRLASSLATAALEGHFEHPASRYCASSIPKITVGFERKLSFSAAC